MANCLEELDNAIGCYIAKLHQNFQELRYHLEKSFLEQGRALLKFEAQWKDLKKDHLQQMGWESTSPSVIGVKRMGDLDSEPFQTACKRKYPMDEAADDQAAMLCSLWEDYLADSSWYPFKMSMDPSGVAKYISFLSFTEAV